MDCEVKILKTYDNEEKALSLWSSLIEEAHHGFFQSLTWITVWLSINKNNKNLMLIYGIKNDIMQFGFFIGKQSNVKHKLIPANRGYINNTGLERIDEITPEESQIVFRNGVDVDELGIDLFKLLSVDEILVNAAFSYDLDRIIDFIKPKASINISSVSTFQVKLEDIRGSKKDYLDSLSKNTRGQLRRSIKQLQHFGDINLDVARDVSEAKEFLNCIKSFHAADVRRQSGGFNLVDFMTFHEKLIEMGFPKKEIVLMRIKVGETPLAYLYYFNYQKKVYFYQSGINYALKPKPGYVAHWAAIEYFKNSGVDTYDFLAGDYQYKRSLSTSQLNVHSVKLQSDSWIAKLERMLRKLANKKVHYLR